MGGGRKSGACINEIIVSGVSGRKEWGILNVAVEYGNHFDQKIFNSSTCCIFVVNKIGFQFYEISFAAKKRKFARSNPNAWLPGSVHQDLKEDNISEAILFQYV